MIHHATVDFLRPSSSSELAGIFADAQAAGKTISLRGGGNCYGETPLNDGGMVLDMTALDRVLAWDPAVGIARVEPGVTIEKLWETVVGDGYWPAVVPGTMKVTVGGACSLDIHGKNHFALGSFRDHVLSLKLMTTDGEILHCSATENQDVFDHVLGGLGLLGCLTEIELKLKKVSSGQVDVEPIVVDSFAHMTEVMEGLSSTSDYLVGWHDGFAAGDKVGRGLIHRANHPKEGDDAFFDVKKQGLPSTLLGVVPRSWMWWGLWFFLNKPGMRFINYLKFLSGKRNEKKGVHRQGLAAFHFLLDYVPHWKKSYKPGGLIQFQSFVPKDRAAQVFEDLLRLCQRRNLPPYLVVTKRHFETKSLLPYAVDGFSQALDIRVTKKNRGRVENLVREMEEIVFAASGRFYLAKDGMMTPESFRRYVDKDRLEAFRELKARLDPRGVLQSDLSRRLKILSDH